MNKRLVNACVPSTRFAKLLTATLVALCAVPQIAFAINKCTGGNHYATQNLGTVTSSTIVVHPTGDPQATPTSQTVTLSGPGPFSVSVGFNYEPECPGELYEVTITGTYVLPPVTGVLYPKYRIVGLTYAPPGSKSTATYTNGFQSGTATSITTTVANEVTVTAKLTTGVDLFGFLNGSATATDSAGWTLEQDNSSSLALAQQYSSGLTVPAPPLVSGQDLGVDHDYDTVYVWINPVDQFAFNGTTPTYNGSYYDQRDGVTPEECNGTTYAGITGMDVVPLTIGQLRGTQTITDPCLLERLSRPWDTVLGGLTGTDFLQIATADPFYAKPSFNPNTDTSGRFQVPAGTTEFPFVPGSATHIYSASASATSTAGKTVKNTYTVGFSLSGQAGASFFADVQDNFTVSDKITYTNQSSSTITSGTSQSMSYSVVPPAIGSYDGATEIQVWEDNIYGTFMFFPEN
jgi:hypothetical protein